jgi:hypothetical protein
VAAATLAPLEFVLAVALAAHETVSSGESQISTLMALITAAELVALGEKLIAYEAVAPAFNVVGVTLRLPIWVPTAEAGPAINVVPINATKAAHEAAFLASIL